MTHRMDNRDIRNRLTGDSQVLLDSDMTNALKILSNNMENFIRQWRTIKIILNKIIITV